MEGVSPKAAKAAKVTWGGGKALLLGRENGWEKKKKRGKSKKVGRGPTTDRRVPRKEKSPRRLGSGRLWQMLRCKGRHLGATPVS